MQPGRAGTSGFGLLLLLLALWVGWVAPVRPTHGVLVLSCPPDALRVHVCAVSWASWILFTGVPAWCVVLLLRCPGPLGSCSLVCPLGVLFCLCGVLGHLASVHRCAGSALCFACAVSSATWLLFTGVPAWFVVLRVRCPGPLGSCSLVCPLCVLFCLCGVLGNLAPVHRCARSGAFLCACGVLGHLAPVHRCARSGALLCACGVLGHLAPVHRCARVEWRGGGRGQGKPGWNDAPHRTLGVRGKGGGHGRDAGTDTSPNPQDLPRAPRSHNEGTAPAKAVVAHSATHQPHG